MTNELVNIEEDHSRLKLTIPHWIYVIVYQIIYIESVLDSHKIYVNTMFRMTNQANCELIYISVYNFYSLKKNILFITSDVKLIRLRDILNKNEKKMLSY